MNTLSKVQLILAIIVSMIMLSSCGTDSNDVEELFIDGIHQGVLEILDEEMLGIIENALEMPIHRGSDPPIFSKHFFVPSNGITFMMTPLQFYKSTVPDEWMNPDTNLSAIYFRFNNQNTDNHTIDFDTNSAWLNRIQIGKGFVTGRDNRFTVFGLQEHVKDEGVETLMVIFSGVITEQDIESPHATLFMIDDGEAGGDIPSGTGRSFVAEDNLATISSWPD